MHYLIVIVLSLLLSMPGLCFAQAAPTDKKPQSETKESKPDDPKPELTIVGKRKGEKPEDFVFGMNDTVTIKATGKSAELIRRESAKPLTLHLNGVAMPDLTPNLEQKGADSELYISYHIVRDPEKDESRGAWDKLFKRSSSGSFVMAVRPALAVAGGIPTTVLSDKTLSLYVARDATVYATLIIGLAILLIAYYLLVTRTNMLRDEDTGYYSLGKSQMAFWGILVLLAFTAVWVLTGTMERIPPQTLVLLGISAATGLGAIAIGDNKRSEAKNKLAKLTEEQQTLQNKQTRNPPTITADETSRLTMIPPEIAQLKNQLGPGISRGFWRDICDDGKGAGFHRLQTVLWTIVLGAVFVSSVIHVMSMPQFSDTLLTLMGISNATYLGFKIPEKL
jgi:hypothetical protein